MERKELNERLTDKYQTSDQPLLIDGSQGTGKSFAVLQYLHSHKEIPSAYINLKLVNSFDVLTSELVSQFHYIPKGYGFSDASGGLDCLEKALIRAQRGTGHRPLLCIDHIDRTLPYNDKPSWLATNLISSKSINLADKGVKTVFIASDNASQDAMLSMSGVRSRLSCYTFAEEPEAAFIDYLKKHEDPFKRLTSSDEDFHKCFEVFDSSFRYLSYWVQSGKKLEGMLFEITQ
jgi:hypothetical protein